MYIAIEDGVGVGTYTNNLLEIVTPADNTQVKSRLAPLITPVLIGDQLRISCYIEGSTANPQNCSVTFYFSYENKPVALSSNFAAAVQITDMTGSGPSDEDRISALEARLNSLTQ